MADNRQFGTPKVPGSQPGDSGHCAQCESMLADALDGTLTPTDQATFDAHMAHCGPCAGMLADARRGAAWLEMLRDPRPEPPAELLEKILARTSGASAAHPLQELPGTSFLPAPFSAQPALAPRYVSGSVVTGKVLPFRTRFATSIRQVVLQPRLAMTAAMAFFSIALTMSLTGVRLQDLHASDLRPGNFVRDFYSANAHIVQYYEGLRVVYELESRVHDFESTSDTDVSAGTQVAPSLSPSDSTPTPDQPADDQPATPTDQPDQAQPKAAPQPEHRQRERKRPAPRPGISHRDSLNPTRHLVAAAANENSFRTTINARAGGQA